MSITEFLLARIAEDEAALERTGWYPHSTHGQDAIGTYRADCPDCLGVPSRARVLAECKAKRAIIAEHSDGDPCDAHDGEYKTITCDTILYLAAVYADHPDYRQEWAL